MLPFYSSRHASSDDNFYCEAHCCLSLLLFNLLSLSLHLLSPYANIQHSYSPPIGMVQFKSNQKANSIKEYPLIFHFSQLNKYCQIPLYVFLGDIISVDKCCLIYVQNIWILKRMISKIVLGKPSQ